MITNPAHDDDTCASRRGARKARQRRHGEYLGRHRKECQDIVDDPKGARPVGAMSLAAQIWKSQRRLGGQDPQPMLRAEGWLGTANARRELQEYVSRMPISSTPSRGLRVMPSAHGHVTRRSYGFRADRGRCSRSEAAQELTARLQARRRPSSDALCRRRRPYVDFAHGPARPISVRRSGHDAW